MWFAGQIELLSLIERNCLEEAMPAFSDHRSVRKNTVVYTPDDQSNYVYVLKTGSVRLYRLTEDGQEITLSFIKPGMMFGDGDVLNETRYSHHAQTLGPSVICHVRRADFRDLLNRYEVINQFILKSHYRRWKEAQQLIENLSLHDVRKRLIHMFVMLANQIGSEFSHDSDADAVLIDLPITQDKLADYIGTSRESVNRHFKDLKAEGLVDMYERKVVLTHQFGARYLPMLARAQDQDAPPRTLMPGRPLLERSSSGSPALQFKAPPVRA